MLATLDRRVPGLRDSVVFQSLGTPLTNDFYLQVTRGNLYGIAKSRFQLLAVRFPADIEVVVPGLPPGSRKQSKGLPHIGIDLVP